MAYEELSVVLFYQLLMQINHIISKMVLRKSKTADNAPAASIGKLVASLSFCARDEVYYWLEDHGSIKQYN